MWEILLSFVVQTNFQGTPSGFLPKMKVSLKLSVKLSRHFHFWKEPNVPMPVHILCIGTAVVHTVHFHIHLVRQMTPKITYEPYTIPGTRQKAGQNGVNLLSPDIVFASQSGVPCNVALGKAQCNNF